jgi:hypothetical protein
LTEKLYREHGKEIEEVGKEGGREGRDGGKEGGKETYRCTYLHVLTSSFHTLLAGPAVAVPHLPPLPSLSEAGRGGGRAGGRRGVFSFGDPVVAEVRKEGREGGRDGGREGGDNTNEDTHF